MIISYDLAHVLRICADMLVLRYGKSAAAQPIPEVDGDRPVAHSTGAAPGSPELTTTGADVSERTMDTAEHRSVEAESSTGEAQS